MKKIIKIGIVLTIVFYTFNVFACPHVDDNGIPHFQFYNEDYTMMYPMVNYFYSRDVEMNPDGVL